LESEEKPPPQHFWEMLELSIFDYAYLLLIAVALILLHYHGMSNTIYWYVLLMALGVWLISKPSDWVADSVIHLGIYFGFSDYVLGILSSLTAILGELTIVIFSVILAVGTASPEFLDFAVLTTLFSMTFNLLTLGVIIMVRGEREIGVPDPILARELEIIDMIYILSFLSAFVWIVNMEKERIILPKPLAFLFIVIYVIYVRRIITVKKKEAKDDMIYKEAGIKIKPRKPEMSLSRAILFLALGGALTTIGGDLIVESVKFFLNTNVSFFSTFGDPLLIVSMIVGGASALYDMIISLRYTSEGRVLISIGGLIGSIPPLFMLLLGSFGVFFGLPIDGKIALLLMSLSVSLLFLRHAITDDKKLDSYEGTILLLLQLVTLLIVIQGFQ